MYTYTYVAGCQDIRGQPVCIHMYRCIYTYISVCVYICVWIYIHVHILIHVCTYTWIYMCALGWGKDAHCNVIKDNAIKYIYIYIYKCIYIYLYIHIDMYTRIYRQCEYTLIIRLRQDRSFALPSRMVPSRMWLNKYICIYMYLHTHMYEYVCMNIYACIKSRQEGALHYRLERWYQGCRVFGRSTLQPSET